jgi:hypothetical protein
MRRRVLAVCLAALVIGATSASASAPLALDQPLGIDVAPGGTLLATFAKPWGVARARSGGVYVSDGGRLRRVDPGHAPVTVATAPAAFEIGPVAVTPTGDVVYATAFALYRLRGGKGCRRSSRRAPF